MPLDKILCLSANAILTIIALWSIASVFFENATIDSIIARFSVASACIGQPIFKTSPYPDNIPHYGICTDNCCNRPLCP